MPIMDELLTAIEAYDLQRTAMQTGDELTWIVYYRESLAPEPWIARPFSRQYPNDIIVARLQAMDLRALHNLRPPGLRSIPWPRNQPDLTIKEAWVMPGFVWRTVPSHMGS